MLDSSEVDYFSMSCSTARARLPRRTPVVVSATIAVFVASIIGAWGVSQRLRPAPMPPYLAFLLETRLTASIVGPESLLDRAGIRPGMRVLDAGSGPGRLTLPAARRVGPGGVVLALDGQQAMLDKLRARLRQQSIGNVRPLRAELGTGQLPVGETFDRVILTMVIGEIRKRPAALGELYAATAPGGVLSLTETLEPDYRRRGTVRREVEAAGFRFEGLYGGWVSYTMNFVKPSHAG